MISCPLKSLQQWKDLVNIYGENKATGLWVKYEGYPPDYLYSPKQIEPIPLNEESEAIYKQYNLINKNGGIKNFLSMKTANKFAASLNQSPNYSFYVRNTPGGIKILLYPKKVVEEKKVEEPINRNGIQGTLFSKSNVEKSNSAVSQILNRLKKELPIEIANAVTVLRNVPKSILGKNNLFLSIKNFLEDNGIKDEILINWVGVNKDSLGHPKNLKSEQQILDIIQERLTKKQKESNYNEFKTNSLALESFRKWNKALEKYPLPFQEAMLTHALKWLNNPVRRSKYVLQLSDVALTQAYGIVVNKPHELNRIGKLYDQEVIATVSDAIGHEPSASGKGYWVHIPRTINVGSKLDYETFDRFELNGNNYTKIDTYRKNDEKITKEEYNEAIEEQKERIKQSELGNTAQFKANVELLRKLSPSTWCTASGMASHYVENYDNYLLIVDGVTVAGIEATNTINSNLRENFTSSYLRQEYTIIFDLSKGTYKVIYPSNGNDVKSENIPNDVTEFANNRIKNSKGKRQVKEVTSRANNGTSSIDHYDDILAFFEKHNLDTNNQSLQSSKKAKDLGKVDADEKDFDIYDYDYIPAWDEGDDRDDPGLEYRREREEWDREFQEDLDRRSSEVEKLNTVEEVLQNPDYLEFFENLKYELKNNEEIAREGIKYSSYYITYLDSNLPFYNELVKIALEDNPDVFQYLPQEVKDNPEIKKIYDDYQNEKKDKDEAEKLRVANLTPEQLEAENRQPDGTLNDDLPFSKTNDSIQGYYDPKTDKVVIIAENTPLEEASKVAIHEVAHRGMLRMAKELGGEKELFNALKSAEKQLMEKLPELLKRTGHTSLDNLMLDYGFDKNSEEGKFKLLQELAARWAETLIDKPKPSWWKDLLQKIGDWIKQFTGKVLTEKEVDELIGGFVKYGTQNLNDKNLKSNAEAQYSKKNEEQDPVKKKEPAKKIGKIEQYFQTRIAKLTKDYSLAKKDSQKEAIEKELELTKQKYAKSKEKDLKREAEYEFGKHSLELVEQRIDFLLKDKGQRFSTDLEYVNDVLDIWFGIPSLTDEVIRLREKIQGLMDDYLLENVHDNTTAKVKPTLEQIKQQTEDIGTFREWTGSLIDVANYIASTIGNIIKTSQTKIERQSNAIFREIELKIEEVSKTKDINEIYKEIIFLNEDSDTKTLIPLSQLSKVSPEAQEFYKFYQSKLEELMKITPTLMRRNDAGELETFVLNKYFIPNVYIAETLREKLSRQRKTLFGIFKERKLGDTVKDENLKADIIDLEYIKKIPSSVKSDDLGHSLFMFAKSMYHYNEMSDILPKVRLLQRSIFDTEYVQGSNPNSTKTGKDSKMWKMVEGFIKAQVKGETKKDEGKKGLYKKNGVDGEEVEVYLDATGSIDSLLRWNSLLRIGLSPITALANVSFGKISNFFEGFAGQFYTRKDLRIAEKLFWQQNFNKDSVMNKILADGNILQELTDKEQSESLKTSEKDSIDRLTEMMYSPQKWGEKYIQSSTFLAIMHKEGYINSDGELTDSYNELSDKSKQELFNKVQRVNHMLHGRYSPQESGIGQQSVIYRAASQFRKWMPSAIENRFDAKHYDERLQADIEGRYRSFVRNFVLELFVKGDVKSAFYNLIMPVLNAEKALASGLTPSEIYNMRKMLIETTSFLVVTLLYAAGTGDDDDDKELRRNPLFKTTMLTLNRISGDIAFFYSPMQINNLGANAFPVQKLTKDLINISLEVPRFFTDKSEFTSGINKGKERLPIKVLGLIPGSRPVTDFTKIFSKFELDEIK
jgi:hypothetical protein